MSWENYFQKNKARPVRPLYARALTHLSKFPPKNSFAVDLGCGAGIETVDLLKRGWSVMAIDREPSSISVVQELAGAQLSKSLKTHYARFEELLTGVSQEILKSYLSDFDLLHLEEIGQIAKSEASAPELPPALSLD